MTDYDRSGVESRHAASRYAECRFYDASGSNRHSRGSVRPAVAIY